MRVLRVIHHPIFGGPHNSALRLATPLAMRGWSTVVLLPAEPGNAADRLRAGGVDLAQLPLGRLRASLNPRTQLRFLLRAPYEVGSIRKLIREHGINLVDVCGLVNPHAAIAARLEGVPVVWEILDTRAPMTLRRAMMPLVTTLADAILSTGHEVARVHPGAEALGDRLVTYYPPVATDEFGPDPGRRGRARQELGVPDGALLIGTVSNFNPQKGIEYLVRAAALVHRDVPDLFVRVFGAYTATHDRYATQLRGEAEERGLLERARLAFVDPGARVPELLPALDVFLFTSVPRSEGVPTAVLEAMACGLPVVATDVGGIREVVQDGVTGFIVPPLNPTAIARATLRLSHDSALRARMGLEARRRAVEHFDVEACARTHVHAFEIALARHARRHRGRGAATRTLQSALQLPDLREMLVCPTCRGALDWSTERIECVRCSLSYSVIDGIPVMLADATLASDDELAHHETHSHTGRQARFFDEHVAEEFEITRPHGAPLLYGWLLAEKFRRSVQGLEATLPGSMALAVCAGSGMDAEFLARAGAHVVAADISLGAARRARERARRYGVALTALVADVQHLPFADRTVDVVYVHDGLHHLEDPRAGLAEMARVARTAVSVTEPARAAATALAVRLGLALEREEAGNRVARFTAAEIADALRTRGLRIANAHRYLMYYRHQPGLLFQLLSLPVVLPILRAAWRLMNAMIGRIGNKVVVTAVRDGIADVPGASLPSDQTHLFAAKPTPDHDE